MLGGFAGKRISEEEGSNRLTPSSTTLTGLVSVSDVINFRLENVIIASFSVCGVCSVNEGMDKQMRAVRLGLSACLFMACWTCSFMGSLLGCWWGKCYMVFEDVDVSSC